MVNFKVGPDLSIICHDYEIFDSIHASDPTSLARIRTKIEESDHPLAVVEIRYDFERTRRLNNVPAHKSLYAIVDETNREIHAIDKFYKHTHHDSAKLALTLDTWFDLFNVPVTRVSMPHSDVQTFKFRSPSSRTPRYSISELPRIERRAQVAELTLRSPAGFHVIESRDPSADVFEAVNFTRYGYFYQSGVWIGGGFQ